MRLEELQKMLDKAPYEQKMLIINKKIYEKYKQEIDSLIKNNWSVDITITNMLDENTSAIVMKKNIFYGIDYGENKKEM